MPPKKFRSKPNQKRRLKENADKVDPGNRKREDNKTGVEDDVEVTENQLVSTSAAKRHKSNKATSEQKAEQKVTDAQQEVEKAQQEVKKTQQKVEKTEQKVTTDAQQEVKDAQQEISSEMANSNVKVSVMINKREESTKKVVFAGRTKKELMKAIESKFEGIDAEMWKSSVLQIRDDMLGYVLFEDEEPISNGQNFNVIFPDAVDSLAKKMGQMPMPSKFYDSQELPDLVENVKSNYNTTDVLQAPPTYPVDINIPFVGRKHELDIMTQAFNANIESHQSHKNTKQMYHFVTISGSVGQGKSRLAVEGCSHWHHKHEDKLFCITLFLDFARGDAAAARMPSTLASQAIGAAVLARFLGVGAEALVPFAMRQPHLFSLRDKVAPYIRQRVAAHICQQASTLGNPLVVNMILDEVQLVPSDLLNGMLSAVSAAFTEGKPDSFVFNVVTTATAVATIQKSATASGVTADPIILMPLNPSEAKSMVNNSMNDQSLLQFLCSDQNSFEVLLHCTGYVPRYLEQLVRCLDKFSFAADQSKDTFSKLLWLTVNQVKGLYSMAVWNRLLSRPSHIVTKTTGVLTLCLWALCGKKVTLTDKLNGITVEEARDSGILTLRCDHRIELSLVLLCAFNRDLQLIEEDHLDPFKHRDEWWFEEIGDAHRLLLGRLHAELGHSMVSYRELYPGGIGHAKDLDIKVPVCLQLVGHRCIGELKDTNLEAVMVEGKRMPIDASCGKVLLRNKMRGTGYDSLICHKVRTTDHQMVLYVEGRQYKSSNKINTQQQSPTEALKLKDIEAEWANVNESDWFSGHPTHTHTLVIITNKPLEQFQEISDNVAAGRHEGWTLPSGVIVVCNQTWQDNFSSTFSHPGIYVPHALNEKPLPDVTQGCECKGDCKTQKCPCVANRQSCSPTCHCSDTCCNQKAEAPIPDL